MLFVYRLIIKKVTKKMHGVINKQGEYTVDNRKIFWELIVT